MAALTKDIDVKNRGNCDRIDCGVVASDILYRGALVKYTAAGDLAPCAAESGATFAGIMVGNVDNSTGLAGAKVGGFFCSGTHLLTFSNALTKANLGDLAYASDDQTVSTTQGTNEQWVGRLVGPFVSATQGWVNINGPCAGGPAT